MPKRPVVLMAVLLLLIGLYIGRPAIEGFFESSTQPVPVASAAKPLPAANGVSNLRVEKMADGRLMASVEYAYTGEPKGAMVRIFQVVTFGGHGPMEWPMAGQGATPGERRFVTELRNPNVHDAYLTHKLVAKLEVVPAPALSTTAIDFRHQWPDPVRVEVEQAIATGKQGAVVDRAVDMIDSGQRDALEKARKLLHKLVELDPGAHAALVELARIAMKTNWSAEGLREAEGLLQGALQIQGDSVNAKVLLGYVYTHQGRYKQAESLFAEVSPGDPPNLWLWANWGQLLAMQGRKEDAIRKYQEAVRRPPPGNTYDRARLDAYENLLRLLDPQRRLGELEAMVRQRALEYPGHECVTVTYATFVAVHQGDAARARSILEETPSPFCGDRTKRLVEGGIRYTGWSEAAEAEKPELLRQARVFHPVSPLLLYWLSTGDKGAVVAQRLVAAGESLSLQDSAGLDALGHALQRSDAASAARLLRIGASPLAEVGPEKMPVALIPVLNQDLDSVRLLRRAGVDYSKIRFRGMTAAEIARSQNDTRLLPLLEARGSKA